jgi:hypothetical protein
MLHVRNLNLNLERFLFLVLFLEADNVSSNRKALKKRFLQENSEIITSENPFYEQ